MATHRKELGDYSIFEYTITDGLAIVGMSIKEINFPKHIIILSIERDNHEFVPSALDVILIGDKLTVLVNSEDAFEIDRFFKIE